MGIMERTLIGFYWALFQLASASSVFAADPGTPQPFPWPWWGEMQWPAFGWIVPLLCFVMMIVMLLFMMRGNMGCMPHSRATERSDVHGSTKRSRSEPSASALGILNERYAKGEIDKQEYEEKKAAITASG
jgi:uncharacterized membrane protein